MQTIEVIRRTYPTWGTATFTSNLGLAHYRAGELEKAAAYEEALKLNPKMWAAYANLLWTYVELGRLEDAKSMRVQGTN